MPLLLPEPESQFCDSDGHPYAGGTIATYVPGTSTPKATWQDNGGTVLNTNPIVLDAAGRAIIFGDGDYRFVLQDAAGNLIYDQWTSSVISDAMLPVVKATTTADALAALGGASTADLNAEISRAEAAENTLTTNLNNEITRATNEENHLQSEIDAINSSIGGGGLGAPGNRAGLAVVDSSGHITATFSPPFTTDVVFFTIRRVSYTTVSVGQGLTTGPMLPPEDFNSVIHQFISVGLDKIVCVGATNPGGTYSPSSDTVYSPGVPVVWWAIGY